MSAKEEPIHWKETALWAVECAALGIAYHWLLNSPPAALQRRRAAKGLKMGPPIVLRSPPPLAEAPPGGIEDEMRLLGAREENR